MPQGTTKKQHYVPQFYLRQWCDNDGGFFPVKIQTRNPPDLKIFNKKSNPSRFCYENFFYAQQTGIEDEVSQIIESNFAEIEGVFSTLLPALEAKIVNREHISDQDKYHLAECMLFLHFKGKRYRDESQQMTDALVKQIYRFHVHNIDKIPRAKAEMERLGITKEQMIEFAERGEYRIDFGNIHHLRIMKDIQGFCNLLTAKYWKVYISRNGEFITTDSPYLDKALSTSFWGNDFLSREQVFVLSPRVVIVARNPTNMYGKKFQRKDITHDKGAVHIVNCNNLMNSISFGFHKNKNLLEEVRITATFLYQHYRNEPDL